MQIKNVAGENKGLGGVLSPAAHKTWSRSFLLKDFPLSGEECCVRTLKTAVWQTNHRHIAVETN